MDWPRLIEPLLYPLGWFWLLLLLLAFRSLLKRKWPASAGFILMAAFILAIGGARWPYQLLATLEEPYLRHPSAPLPRADAVVVLGGMLSPSRRDPFGFQFSSAADRIITGIELVRREQAPLLVLGGGGGWRTDQTEWDEAQLLENWMAAWGIPDADRIALLRSRDTREEAVRVRKLLDEKGWERIILVTSGYHMKRALATFNNLEIPAEPFACDFIGVSRLERGLPYGPFPRLEGFKHLDIYLREKIGWWYYRWKGWIQRPDSSRRSVQPGQKA
jgi:uncharacterized SAM-binding protein YcdF (DUF218 family)